MHGKIRLYLIGHIFLFFASLLGQESLDTAGTNNSGVERRKFWDSDLLGLVGFYPYSYNRVDGLMAAWGIVLSGKEKISYTEAGVSQVIADRSRPEISFSLFVPTARSFVGGKFTLEQSLSIRKRLEAGLNLYSGTSNSDTWRAHEPEISLTCLVTGQDRRFHYDLRGGDIFLRQSFPGGVGIRAGYFRHKIRSLGAGNVWTLAKSSILKENPPVDAGAERGLDFTLTLDRLNSSIYFPEGWELEFSAEKNGGFLGGEFDFTLWSISLLRAIKFAGDNNYVFTRLIGKTSSDELPPHKLLNLGRMVMGLETFDRDFNLFERRGNRLWFISAGYSRLVPAPRSFFSRFMYDLSFDGIFDAGGTFLAGTGDGPLSLFRDGFGKLESSVAFGAGFTVSRTRVGLYYTYAFNPDYDGPRFLLRFVSNSHGGND